MMQAKELSASELRIGNLVTSKTWKGAHPISGINKTEGGFIVEVKGYEHKKEEGVYFDLAPIPITEEWLVKAGFEKIANRYPTSTTWKFENNGSVYHFQLNTKYDITNPNCGYMGIFDDSDDVLDLEGVLKHTAQTVLMNFAWHIKYLHQLQNLFFCLCGKELEFTT